MENANKLSWVALRSAVARRAGVNDKVAKQFLDALVEQLTQALEQHESVRINGLGTFRIQETAARKSVDVRTGEEITIPPYYRLSFVSDASLKKGIGFDNPTITPDSNPMRRLSEQADEIVGILADMGQHAYEPSETTDVTEKEEDTPVIEETPAVEGNPSIEETPAVEDTPVVEETPVIEETPAVEETPVIEETPAVEETPVINNEPAKTEEAPVVQATAMGTAIASPSSSYSYTYIPPTEPRPKEKTKEKKTKSWLVVGIVLVVVCVLLIAAYFVLQYKYSDWMNNLIEKSEAEQILEAEDGQENDTTEWEKIKLSHSNEQEITEPAQDESAQQEPVQQDVPAQVQKPKKESVLTAPRSYKELITIEQMSAGNTLTLMAQKYYGNKDLWVFIYEANLGKIKSPTHIETGTSIRIPKLSEELMDLNNPDTKELVRQLSSQYLKR